MLWASFHGKIKGPCLFWEKKWGSIGSESYYERIVLIIDGYISLESTTISISSVMQDGAPGHASKHTREELRNRGIYPVY